MQKEATAEKLGDQDSDEKRVPEQVQSVLERINIERGKGNRCIELASEKRRNIT